MKIILTSVLAALLALTACGDDGTSESADVTVAASFFPLAEVARAVAGNRAAVIDLTPPGTEPHDVELTSRQVDDAVAADVLLYLGEGFQPAVERLSGQTDGEAVDLLAGLPVVEGDAHVWLDPQLMTRIVAKVRDALSAADPDGDETYTAGALRFTADLRELDGAYRRGLADCDRNVMVTSHASFLYLTSRYQLEQEPISGTSPEAEPDPARLTELTDLIRDAGVTTVFTEPLVEDGAAETLARETGTRTAPLDPIEGLTRDAGDQTGYVELMERNLEALRAGLGCR